MPMTISTTELAAARERLNGLLDALGLPAFGLQVDPGPEGWQLAIECETAQGWQRITLDLPHPQLNEAANDPEARRRLLIRLDQALGGCLRVA
jgi:hypothetical protein